MQLYIVTGASRGLGWNLAQLIARKPEAALLAISRSGLPRPLERADDVRCDLASPDGQRTAPARSGRSWAKRPGGRPSSSTTPEPPSPPERSSITITRSLRTTSA